MHAKFTRFAVIPLLLAAGGAYGVDESQALVVNCYTCHGTDGISPAEIPSINGKSAEYLLDKLAAFKNGSHDSTIMGRIARGYSNRQLKMIADFLGTD